MSVIVKGMDMPKKCYDCVFEEKGWCCAVDGIRRVESIDRPDWCPLEELVQCGECKWANSRGECAYNGEEAEDIKTGYCNYGKRKDEVEE